MTEREKLIDLYIEGDLSGEALEMFEDQMASDSSLKSEVEFYLSLKKNLDAKDWDLSTAESTSSKAKNYKKFLETKEGKRISNNIKQAESLYFDNNSAKRIKIIKTIISTAAAVLLLLMAWFLFPSSPSSSMAELYVEYRDMSELPSLINRGGQNELSRIEQLVQSESFAKAFAAIENYQATIDTSFNSQLLIYKGICALEVNDIPAALKSFRTVREIRSMDDNKAEWFLALTYLKANDAESCKQLLESIVSRKNSYNHFKAKELLEDLN